MAIVRHRVGVAAPVINTLSALERKTEDVTDKAALLAAIRVLEDLYHKRRYQYAQSLLDNLTIEP